MASIWCREAQHFRMQGCKNDDNGSSSILLNFYNCFTSCNRKSNRWPGHIFLCFLFKMRHFLLILFAKIQKEDFRISKCNVLLTFLWDLNKINMDNIRNPISSSSYLRLANFYAKNLANFFFLCFIYESSFDLHCKNLNTKRLKLDKEDFFPRPQRNSNFS